MPAPDLQDPLDLERVEEAAAAAARAVSGDPGLRFRGHALHLGSRPAPARAPHLHPSVDTQELADLRGSVDGIALRVLHSDRDVYARYRPDGGVEELVFEMLEQFRVEALAPHSAPGLRANLRRRFRAWSDEYIAEGLLENDLGLLVFSVLQVCRSRILAEPIEELVNDHTEATRFGIYEVLGPGLLRLRPSLNDQEAFDREAAEIARAVGHLSAERDAEGSGTVLPSAVLAMLEFNAFEQSDTPPTVGDGHARTGIGAGYAVFTGDYDRVVPVDELVLPHARRAARHDLELLLDEHRPLGAYFARTAQTLFPAPIASSWESELEEGHLDPRLLSGLASGRRDGRIFRRPSPEDRPSAAVAVLVDCSGSMKAIIPQVAVLTDLWVRALDSADIATEVLGYTTGAWSGGRPYREWLARGRPPHPGRLNETLHLVFKDADMSWRRSRDRLAALLWTPMFREGVDGEAVQWAASRLRAIDAPRRHLVVISDGSPMDGATALTNDEGYLDRHLADVVERLESRGDIRVCGLGIGHDMSAYLRRSRIVDPDRILDPAVARTLMGFLAAE